MENQTITTGYRSLVTRLRHDSNLFGLHGWTMPAVGLKIDTGIIMCGIGSRIAGPRSVFAQGRSMPISRGSPSIYDD
jgi:hypothetical protein